VATLKHSIINHHSVAVTTSDDQVLEESIEARRARRMAALRKVAGIWSDRPDIPADGLEYQRELRAHH
jgi:hypothetical protein